MFVFLSIILLSLIHGNASDQEEIENLGESHFIYMGEVDNWINFPGSELGTGEAMEEVPVNGSGDSSPMKVELLKIYENILKKKKLF